MAKKYNISYLRIAEFVKQFHENKIKLKLILKSGLLSDNGSHEGFASKYKECKHERNANMTSNR